MVQMNSRIVLASRPQGAPTLADFRLEETPAPVPAEGQMLLQTVYLSLDPYMRGRMSEGPSYAAPVAVGEVMVGGGIARVIRSNLPGFHEGELVVADVGWQRLALSDGRGVARIPQGLAQLSWALGVLGMPGLTAWYGLTRIGAPKPGETVVVAAATGGVGSVVGQIAKLKGCHVVGVAGGARKCAFAVEALGFDACIDHRAEDFESQLAAACPDGIDIYFENVGGRVLFGALPLLRPHARIPLCGVISHYNGADGASPDRSALLMRTLLVRKVRLEGFIVADSFDQFPAFLAEMIPWVMGGKVKPVEDIVEGLEAAPEAFLGLLQGKNFGKLVVRVST